MTKVLIIGMDGFLGGILQQGLSELGYEVYGTVFRHTPHNDHEIALDVTRAEQFQNLDHMTFDAVIHNAGVVNQNAPGSLMYDVHVNGTRNVLAWAAKAAVPHVIHISSSGVYGVRSMGQNLSEDCKFRFVLLGVDYQKTKAAAEALYADSGVGHTLLRLPPIIGAGDSTVSPILVEALQQGRFFRCSNRNPLVSILNAHRFPQLLHAVLQKAPTNTAYNCSSHELPWLELVAEYARLLNVLVPDTRKPLASALGRMHDKDYLFLAANSRFGSRLPNTKFNKAFGERDNGPWQEAVAKAVGSYSQ